MLPDCVHIFFVTGSGKVSTFSEPSTLRIFRFKEDSTSQNPSDATTFIQVKSNVVELRDISYGQLTADV